ncbi:polysaccharide deacetylase family protein [Pyxidicoccus sp. 3LFB2]
MTTQVLMLHRVLPDQPTAFGRPSCYRLRGTALTPGELDRLLEAGSFLSLDEVVESLAAGRQPPSGRVLTFDDGYREWSEWVAERLDRQHVPATFFVCPAFLRREAAEAHPVDAFYWLLDHARRSRFELRLPDGVFARGTLETNEGKAELITGELKRRVVRSPRDEVRELLRLLSESLHVELPADLAHGLYPSEEELRALASAGHRLGGHGMSHRHLPVMGAVEAAREISTSLAWVARLAGSRSAPFAYPDGAFDLETGRRVEQAGATCALTCVSGAVTESADLFRLPREFITPWHPMVTALVIRH